MGLLNQVNLKRINKKDKFFLKIKYKKGQILAIMGASGSG
jgi:ABC-type lipoprotein export system ATPase subunit